MEDEALVAGFRHPDVGDGKWLWKIAGDTGVLDQNSVYHYLIMCSHFRKTSMVAVADGVICGFVTGYILPGSQDTLFVWQVAIAEPFRGKGLGLSLLQRLFSVVRQKGCRYIESTITPSNQASISLFRALAKGVRGCFVLEDVFFKEDDFGGEGHEDEMLCRIGPVKL